jgi:hypothetical protein
MKKRMDFVYWVVATLAEPLWLANELIAEICYGQGKVIPVTTGQTSLSTVQSWQKSDYSTHL